MAFKNSRSSSFYNTTSRMDLPIHKTQTDMKTSSTKTKEQSENKGLNLALK